jgi:hypothetical protein
MWVEEYVQGKDKLLECSRLTRDWKARRADARGWRFPAPDAFA